MLTDKVSLITGASGALGSAIAVKFAAQGSQVAVHYHKNKKGAGKIVAQLEGIRSHPASFGADLCDRHAVQRMVDDVLARFGRIDVLVNCAGKSADRLLQLMPESQWDEIIGANLTGTVNTMQCVLRHMVERAQGGKIVTIGSAAGLIGQATRSNYAASKGALIGLTRSLAREFAPAKIYVNAVLPAVIEGGLSDDMPFGQQQFHKAITPLKRFGKPSEVADAALFLASDMSSYVTGEILAVSGGEVMWYL